MNGKFFICFLRGYFMDQGIFAGKEFVIDPILERCMAYDVNTDTNGARGHELADEFFEKYGTFNYKEIMREYKGLKTFYLLEERTRAMGLEKSQVNFMPSAS